GVSESRRGQALGLAFGVGPIVAFAASLVSQPLLKHIAYPWNFATLFAATVPAMALAAYFSSKFVVPQPSQEVTRLPFVAGVFGGLGEFFRNRLIRVAAIATILVVSGYTIINNITLFTQEAIGEASENYVG